MEKTNRSSEWLEIAKAVSENPFTKIKCPNCGQNYLKICIVPWINESKVDVHLICPSCNARNVITKSIPAVPPRAKN